MKKEKRLDWDIIRRHIEGELSQADKKQLEEWLQADASHSAWLRSVFSYYQRTELPVVDSARIEKAWQTFQTKQNKRTIATYWKRWMYAASIFIALGIGSYLLLPSSHQAVIPTENSIMPGSTQATLILSNGQSIALNNHYSTPIIDQETRVSFDSSGIHYQEKHPHNSSLFHTLQIPRGGEFRLTLSDGTQVWLNSQSELTYPLSFSGTERRIKLNGEAYFEVAKNEKQPFIIETPEINIQVLGTSFNVNAYKETKQTVTTLVSGVVSLQNKEKHLYTLSPNEQAVWNKEDQTLKIREVNVATYTQWREGKFVFRDHTLEEIMQILSRWYNMDYIFESQELKKEKFYGIISRYENIQELLKQFEKTGKVKFAYQEEKIYIK